MTETLIYYEDELDDVVSREHAMWKPLSFFDDGEPLLVPDGLFEYLNKG